MLNATIKRETLVALYGALKNCRPPCDVVVFYDSVSLKLACIANNVEEDREEGCFIWCGELPNSSFIDYTFDEFDNTPPIRLDPTKVFSLFDVVKGYEEEVRICLVQQVIAIATSTCQNYTELEGVNFKRASFFGSMLGATVQPNVTNTDLVCSISRQKLIDLITAAAGLCGTVEVHVITHSGFQTLFTSANVTELVVHGNRDDHSQSSPIVGSSSFIVDTYVLKAILQDEVKVSIVVSRDNAAYHSYLVLHYNGFNMQILYVEPGSGEDDPKE